MFVPCFISLWILQSGAVLHFIVQHHSTITKLNVLGVSVKPNIIHVLVFSGRSFFIVSEEPCKGWKKDFCIGEMNVGM